MKKKPWQKWLFERADTQRDDAGWDQTRREMDNVQVEIGDPQILEKTAAKTVILAFPLGKIPCKAWQTYFHEEVRKWGMLCAHPHLKKDFMVWELSEEQANMTVFRDRIKELVGTVNYQTAIKTMVDSREEQRTR